MPTPVKTVVTDDFGEATTPLGIYRAAKQAHPGLLLLLRVGDFYETFDADAETVARTCGLSLGPSRGGVAFVAFPHQGLETHLGRLLRAGHRVAVMDTAKE